MQIFKILPLALIVLLSSCSRSSEIEPPSEAELATFVLDPLSATSDVGAANETFANIPTSRLLNFTACLKDVAVLEPVTGASFRVSEGGREIKISPTDAKGCLYWSETFSFEATRQETFFEVERTIEAVSIHKGRVSLRLAVNPWKKGAGAVVDLRFQQAPIGLDRSRVQENPSENTGLVIETVNADLEIVRSSDAVAEADLQLSFEPKLSRIGLDGARVLESLTSGKFLVRVQIMAISSGALTPLTKVEEIQNQNFALGSVQSRSRVKILRKIPRESTLELSFEAIPVNAPLGLKPIKGRVSLGRLTSLNISKSSPLRLEPQLNFLEPLPSATKGRLFGFEMGRVRATDVVVKELDNTGNPKSIELELISCLRNTISQEKILSQGFSIFFLEKTLDILTDAEDGCLKWRHTFPFDYHAKESFVRTEVEIQSTNEFYGREKVKRFAHLNLWNYENPEKIVVDEEYDGEPATSVTEGGSGSELLLSNAMFTFAGRTFEIDSHLNLSTKRKYRFELQPKIRRLSRSKGWLPPQGTGNGRYRIRFLLETNDTDNPTVVDAQTIEAESRADTITATVNFQIEDLRLMATRLVLSMEVMPLDQSSSLETRPYSGTFDLSGFSIRLEPRQSRISERMKPRAKNPTLAQNAKDIFLKAKGHKILDEARMQSLKMSDADLEKYFSGGDKKALGKLCSLYFDPNGWFSSYRNCAADPEAYLVLATTEHVRQISDSRLSGSAQTSALSVSAGLNFGEFESNDESSSKSRSHSVDSGAKMSVPLLSLIGLDLGFGVGVSDSWNSSKSFVRGKGRSTSIGSNHSKQILIDEADFEINAEVDRCLIIGHRTDLKKKDVFMACGPKPIKKKFKETYYLLYQPVSASGLVDSGAPIDERPFISLIRGKARFRHFSKLLQDPEVTLNFSRDLPAPADLMREAENRYDGFFPGLLTPTE